MVRLVGKGDLPGPGRPRRACSSGERSRRLDDEQHPRRTVTEASRDCRTFESPRAGPASNGSSRSGYSSPLVVTPSTPSPTGRRLTRSPIRPRSRRTTGAPLGPGARRNETRAPASRSTACCVPPGPGGRAGRRWRGRGRPRRPPSAPRMTISSAPRSRAASSASSASDSSLAAATRRISAPSAASRSRSPGATESPSPTQIVGRRPSPIACRAPPSAAMTTAAGCAQPGQATSCHPAVRHRRRPTRSPASSPMLRRPVGPGRPGMRRC